MIFGISFYLGTLAIGLYFWLQHTYSYWKYRQVKFIPPTPIFGNFKEVLTVRQSFPEQLWTLYKAKGFEQEPLAGMFAVFRPGLFIRDVQLIKQIMVKDFQKFSNRVVQADPHHDPLGNNNLFFVRYPHWRALRPKLSPVFTSGKVKQMYPLMLEVCQELQNHTASLARNSEIVDIKELSGRYTNEVIGSIAFGVRAHNFQNPNSEFYRSSCDIFEISIRRALEFACILFVPQLVHLLRIKVFSDKSSKFLRESIEHVMAEREKTGLVRNDLIDTLIAMKAEAKENCEETPQITCSHDFLVAQAAVFHTAGFETSSSTMTLGLFELAQQQHLQDRLRAEIREAFEENSNSMPYEKLQELKYLGQVVDETLRKYPVVGFLERECTPGPDEKGYSLEPFSKFVVPAGMPIYVSPMGLHRDEKYWPNPDKFDPDRFAPENRKNLNMDAYVPFGIGPRNCIGMRIGLLQTKLGLAYILKDHRVVVCEKTTKTVQCDPKSVIIANKGGVFLRIEKVEN